MKDFVLLLSQEFQRNGNPKIAAEQKAYMRDQFEFFGLKAPVRREVQKPFLVKQYLPTKEDLSHLVMTLWEKPEREFHLFGQELVFKYIQKFDKQDMAMLEYMVTHKSWWDTVDYIAVHLMGNFFKRYPEERKSYVDKWLQSNNIWLQRCALLFQLKYKNELDTELLAYVITPLLGSKEFFINKAIGWVLREYSRTDGDWVQAFVARTELHPLSKREALRILLKKNK